MSSVRTAHGRASGEAVFRWSLRRIRQISLVCGKLAGGAILVPWLAWVVPVALAEGALPERALLTLAVVPVTGVACIVLIEAMLRTFRCFVATRALPEGLHVQESAWEKALVRWEAMERGEVDASTGWLYLRLVASGLKRRVNVNLELDDPLAFRAAIEAHAPPGHWLVALLREQFPQA
jgi:hypothetical protein